MGTAEYKILQLGLDYLHDFVGCRGTVAAIYTALIFPRSPAP